MYENAALIEILINSFMIFSCDNSRRKNYNKNARERGKKKKLYKFPYF